MHFPTLSNLAFNSILQHTHNIENDVIFFSSSYFPFVFVTHTATLSLWYVVYTLSMHDCLCTLTVFVYHIIQLSRWTNTIYYYLYINSQCHCRLMLMLMLDTGTQGNTTLVTRVQFCIYMLDIYMFSKWETRVFRLDYAAIKIVYQIAKCRVEVLINNWISQRCSN